MTNYKNWHYYKLKGRLDKAQNWEKEFLANERLLVISDKVTQSLAKDAPITSFLTNLINFPTLCLTLLKKGLIYRSYKKCKKEIELIQEEIKKYE